MDGLRLCFLALTCCILVTAVASSSDCKEKEFTGCNRDGKQCVCSTKMACHNRNPFAFRDERRCKRALFTDTCRKNECENNGYCLQTKEGVYICKCSGTGFYGQRCEIKCPKDRSTIPETDRELAEACIF